MFLLFTQPVAWATEPIELQGTEELRRLGDVWAADGHVFAWLPAGKPDVGGRLARWNEAGSPAGETELGPGHVNTRRSPDGRFVLADAHAGESSWWKVLGPDLTVVAEGTCQGPCYASWQPRGTVAAVVSSGKLHLVDAPSGSVHTASTPSMAVAHSWANDGSTLCYLDQVLGPDGTVIARTDYASVDLEPDSFRIAWCEAGAVRGHAVAPDAPANSRVSVQEAKALGYLLPVVVDVQGTRRVPDLGKRPPHHQVSNPGGRPFQGPVELSDGRTVVWRDKALWVIPAPQ